MTIEQKAKAYDEAIERARNHHNNDGLTLEQYETIDIIFPELKESEDENEDERIRKSIICLIEFALESGSAIAPGQNITKEEALAWLEKQGEQKPAWSEEDEHRRTDAIYFLDTAKKHYADTSELDATIDWLKSLKERMV